MKPQQARTHRRFRLLAAVLALSLALSLAVPALAVEEGDALADLYLYTQEDDTPKYWLDFTGAIIDNLVLHCRFRSGDPEWYETFYILDLESADSDTYEMTIHQVYDERGSDISDWFRSIHLSIVQDAILMTVDRDESTLAGGADDNLLSGTYLMEPYVGPAGPAGAGAAFAGDELCALAQEYYYRHNDFYPPEADITDNGDGTYTIHLYEIVDLGEGDSHTATSAWYTVDAFGIGTDDIFGDPIDLTK